MTLGASTALADDSASNKPVSWRQVVLSEIRYSLPKSEQTGESDQNEEATIAKTDELTPSDTIVLPHYVIEGRRWDIRGLDERIEAQRRQAKDQKVMDTAGRILGIKAHTYAFGRKKHFSIGCITVFHVPVMAAVSVSW
ncbi:MAG: hypothetical protein QM715_16980 [Nibricoccus sp.]